VGDIAGLYFCCFWIVRFGRFVALRLVAAIDSFGLDFEIFLLILVQRFPKEYCRCKEDLTFGEPDR
jgi:hypothetical protein